MRKIYMLVAVLSLGSIFTGCGKEDSAASNSDVVTSSEPSYITIEGEVKSEVSKVYFADCDCKIDSFTVEKGDELKKDAIIMKYTDQTIEDAKQKKMKNTLNDALITEVDVVKGQTVAKGTPILTAISKNDYYIEAEMDEELLNNVEEGKEVDIVPVADKSKVYTGTIDDIAQYAYKKDNGDTVIKLKVSFEDKEKFLGYGYHVEVRVKNE